MKILLFSDLHLSPENQPHTQQAQKAMQHAWSQHEDAGLQIFMGDVTHHGDAGSYATLKDLIGDTGKDAIVLPGNHDNRQVLQNHFPAPSGQFADFQQFCRRQSGYDLFCLDSHTPGEDGGSLGHGRLLWLAEQLSASAVPALIFLHHPPLRLGLPGFDGISLREKAAFSELVATHKERMAGIFFGHCHMPISASLHGVPVCGIPSTAIHSKPVFDRIDFSNDPDLPLQYSVLTVDRDSFLLHHIPFQNAACA